MAKAISQRVITLGRNPVNGKDIELAFFKTRDLRGAPYNPRRMRKKEFAGLKASLGRFGLVDLPVWNKRTKQLVAGHQRLVLLRRQRVAETPVIVVDLPEAEEKALNLTLNNPAVAGEWTRGVLGLLDEVKLALPDLSAALRIGEIKLQLDAQPGGGKPGKTDPDAVPEVPRKAVTKRGDLWVLGDHRLLCGDSTKPEDVARVMGGEKAALFATDPPYGVDYGISSGPALKRSKAWEGIKNDDLSGEQTQAFLEATFRAWLGSLEDRAAWYLWHAQKTQGFFTAAAAAAAAGVIYHRQIVWVKPSIILGRGHFHWRHELCLYGWRKNKEPRKPKDRSLSTVWEFKRDAASTYRHPTQKPIECFSWPMQFSSLPGDVCAEPFAGSGTQFIAAEQLGRRCFGIEIEPRFCDVIVRRWEEFAGKKAVLERA